MIKYTVRLHPEDEGSIEHGSNDIDYAHREITALVLPRIGEKLAFGAYGLNFRVTVLDVVHIHRKDGELETAVEAVIKRSEYDTIPGGDSGWFYQQIEL